MNTTAKTAALLKFDNSESVNSSAQPVASSDHPQATGQPVRQKKLSLYERTFGLLACLRETPGTSTEK